MSAKGPIGDIGLFETFIEKSRARFLLAICRPLFGTAIISNPFIAWSLWPFPQSLPRMALC
jgi:hypothetical protein